MTSQSNFKDIAPTSAGKARLTTVTDAATCAIVAFYAGDWQSQIPLSFSDTLPEMSWARLEVDVTPLDVWVVEC